MSEYRDYIVDFPKRCLDLLQHFTGPAKERDREVTLLLMAASAAFVIPHERLGNTHPSNDAARVSDLDSFRRLISQSVAKSGLFPQFDAWRFGTVQGVAPLRWPPAAHPIGSRHSSELLALVRNALAHGNIATDGDPIHGLILYSAKREDHLERPFVVGYKYVSVPVDAFRAFLFAWFALLQTLSLSYRDVLEQLPNAA